MQKDIKHCHNPREEERSFLFDHVHISWDEQITLHQQKTWEISYVIIGKGMRVIGDVIEPFDSGEIILIPPDIPHYWSFDESICDEQGKIENITITFRTELFYNLKTTFPEIEQLIISILDCKNALSFGGETLLKLREVFLQMKTESEIGRISSMIKVLSLISSPEIAKTVGCPVIEDRNTKKLQKVYMYVMDHFQQSLTLEQLAGHVGMERTAFCVFFKKMTGKSFFEFLLEYRINVSCDMLQNTNKTISEICFASGFRDVPYFNRVFKKLKSMTPGKFKEQMILMQY